VLAHPRCKRDCAFVVKAGAINQRFVCGQAKEPGPIVAGLRVIGDGPRFDECETERGQSVERNCILIKTCSQANRISKRQSKAVQTTERTPLKTFTQNAGCDAGSKRKGMEGHFMGRFRWQAKEYRTQQ
jgi:hypothetical protein